MLQASFFSLVAALVTARAAQVPLGSSSTVQSLQNERHPAIRVDKDLAEWDLDKLPNPNATDNLVFETTHSLPQHWPNTRMRNGHNIIPGSIPNGTLLYHGRFDSGFPTGPEWVATDPEHSYFFCRDLSARYQTECWHLTLMTTRPLKVVYFDGSSAVKLPYGSLDAGDLIAWGRVGSPGELFEDEIRRIQDLCKWGEKFGVDGIVRMAMDFEVLLCDFTAGTSIVSFSNLVGGWTNQSTIPQFSQFEVLNAGTWHNHFPGETRIQLDLPGLVSFYDTELVPSLVPIRVGQERWDHRVRNISAEDLSNLKFRLETTLTRPAGASSGIDWKTLIQVIVDRYAQRIELTRYLLNSLATGPDEMLDLAKKAQTQLRIMLTPYLLFSATPTGRSDDFDWAIPIYRLCATTHTYSMESQFDSMTDSEKLLLQAVRGTSREICRVVTKMWVAGVYAGVDPLLDTKESPDISEIVRLLRSWEEQLDRLMGWLDWNVWVKCNSVCGFEETCYLPTWPYGSFPWFKKSPQPSPIPSDDDDLRTKKLSSFELRTMVIERMANEMSNAPQSDEWIRPQPKCIRRIEPYGF